MCSCLISCVWRVTGPGRDKQYTDVVFILLFILSLSLSLPLSLPLHLYGSLSFLMKLMILSHLSLLYLTGT